MKEPPMRIECRPCGILFGHLTCDAVSDEAMDELFKHQETAEHDIQLREWQGLPPRVCKLCDPDKKYRNKDALDEHCSTKKHIIKKNRKDGCAITCELCCKDFASESDRDNHETGRMHMARSRTSYICKLCTHFAPTTNLLHYEAHLKTKAHCLLAGKPVEKKEKQRFECKLCDKSFKFRYLLVRHKKSTKHRMNEMDQKLLSKGDLRILQI